MAEVDNYFETLNFISMLRLWQLDLRINENNSQFPLYLQVAKTMIAAIESGTLKSGDVLPGTRKLASSLDVSRNTITEAYNYLEEAGWLTFKPRIGTFVSNALPPQKQEYMPITNVDSMRIVFDQGLPDINHSLFLDIMREYRIVIKKIQKRRIFLDKDPLGYKNLRCALSQMLNQRRRMKIDEDNICITRGSQMGIFLISQCLLEEGDCIIVENPGYRLAWEAFKYAGASVLFARVDKDGILISDIRRFLDRGKKIKAIYIFPNSQFPTTVVLSDDRRKELIELSNRYGFYIIEDNYCIDLNYSGKCLLPLCSDENLINYIYIGTFSRSINPFLKIGYLVSNKIFLEKVVQLRKIIDIAGDTVMERTLFQIIQDGTFSRHIKKCIPFYRSKRDRVELLLNKYLGSKISYIKPDLGLGYWIMPSKPLQDYDYIISELKKRKVEIISYNYYSRKGPGFYLSFGSLQEEKLELGIKILGDYL